VHAALPVDCGCVIERQNYAANNAGCHKNGTSRRTFVGHITQQDVACCYKCSVVGVTLYGLTENAGCENDRPDGKM